MFATDRRNAICAYLYSNKRIDVSQMSARLGVSEVTIRKDLEALEKTGVLIRTHGGAVLHDAAPGTDLYAEDESAEQRHLRSISRITACLIADGDMIYLGAGSLCASVSLALKEKKLLTVVTNNLTAAVSLCENPGIKVITPLGTVRRGQDSCLIMGPEAMTFLSSLTFDKIVFSVDSCRYSSGFSVQDAEIHALYCALLKHSDQKIIAVPSECFDKNALYSIGGPDVADILVSDESMPEGYIQHFNEHNVKVFTTYDIEML